MYNSKYVQCRNSLGSDKGVGGSVIYSNDEKYEEWFPALNKCNYLEQFWSRLLLIYSWKV